MDVTSLEYSPENPFRCPDWRWHRIARGDKPWSDTWEKRLTDIRVANAGIRDPDLAGAIEVHNGDVLTRAELEARVLARQSDEEIAVRMGIRLGVISIYEAVFFDVRCMLQYVSYVLHCVLGQKLYETIGRDDVPFLWKKYGYKTWGPGLDLLIGGASGDDVLRLGVDAYLEPTARLPVVVKCAIALDRLPVPRTAAELTRLSRFAALIHQCGGENSDNQVILRPLSNCASFSDDVQRQMQECVDFTRELYGNAA